MFFFQKFPPRGCGGGAAFRGISIIYACRILGIKTSNLVYFRAFEQGRAHSVSYKQPRSVSYCHASFKGFLRAFLIFPDNTGFLVVYQHRWWLQVGSKSGDSKSQHYSTIESVKIEANQSKSSKIEARSKQIEAKSTEASRSKIEAKLP